MESQEDPSKKPKVLITIDTEEDEWGDFSNGSCKVENISEIPLVQELFNKYNAKPTYLVNWPVATNDKAVGILKAILDKDNCAIGTHCHPWNTPPFFCEQETEFTSMLSNLPYKNIHSKMANLHRTITDAFGKEPKVFRSGRYGFSSDVARCLTELGYVADSSMTPFWDWRTHSGPDYTRMSTYHYRFQEGDLFRQVRGGPLIEFPLTIGFLQGKSDVYEAIHRTCSRKPFSKMKIIGLLEKLSILNRCWLSPEKSNGRMLVRLAQRFVESDHRFLVLDFHSTSLLPGKCPNVRNASDLKRFLNDIEYFLLYAQMNGYECITLESAVDNLLREERDDAEKCNAGHT